GRDCPDRLSEQGGGLRPLIPHGGRDAADDRRRSQAPRRSHRRHHSWGSAMTHHPHIHMIVPGGGISLKPAPAEAGGTRWVRCKPGFLLPVRVLSRLFRRLFLAALADAHATGRLAFFGDIEGLRRHQAFAAHLAPLKRKNWFVYAKPPFAGPEAVLAYLARY